MNITINFINRINISLIDNKQANLWFKLVTDTFKTAIKKKLKGFKGVEKTSVLKISES